MNISLDDLADQVIQVLAMWDLSIADARTLANRMYLKLVDMPEMKNPLTGSGLKYDPDKVTGIPFVGGGLNVLSDDARQRLFHEPKEN
jgi:hypothetical protein